MANVQLNVPYRSQWDQDAKNHETDCGPTSAAMILNAFGVDMNPDNFYGLIDPPKGPSDYTNFVELMTATKKKGVTMEWELLELSINTWGIMKKPIPVLNKLITSSRNHRTGRERGLL